MKPDRDPFAAGTWEGLEYEQLLARIHMPLAAKLDWLEEAQELVEKLHHSKSGGLSNSDETEPDTV